MPVIDDSPVDIESSQLVVRPGSNWSGDCCTTLPPTVWLYSHWPDSATYTSMLPSALGRLLRWRSGRRRR